MKTSYAFLFAATFLILGSSCIDEVIKFVKVTDTLYLEGKPVTNFVQTTHYDTVWRELVRTDTVEVTVVVKDTVVLINNVETVRTDTVVQIKTDSIFIETIVEKIVNHWDTVIVERIITNVDTTYIDRIVTVHDTTYVTEYEQIVIYEATEYVFPGRAVYYVPEPLRGIVDDYNKEAQAHGAALIGGNVLITYVDPGELPGESWVSTTFQMAGDQQIIQLSSELIAGHSRSPIFREMTRWQLRKQYTNTPGKIMNPLLPPANPVTTQMINELFQ